MSIERVINPGLEIPELSCGQLNEGQQALLEIALYKFKAARELPKVAPEPVVLGGCTI